MMCLFAPATQARCDHSNESSLHVLSHDAICLSKFKKMKFGNLVETCIWPHLAVKGLRRKEASLSLTKQCAINTDGKLLLLGDELCGRSRQ